MMTADAPTSTWPNINPASVGMRTSKGSANRNISALQGQCAMCCRKCSHSNRGYFAIAYTPNAITKVRMKRCTFGCRRQPRPSPLETLPDTVAALGAVVHANGDGAIGAFTDLIRLQCIHVLSFTAEKAELSLLSVRYPQKLLRIATITTVTICCNHEYDC